MLVITTTHPLKQYCIPFRIAQKSQEYGIHIQSLLFSVHTSFHPSQNCYSMPTVKEKNLE